MDSRMIDLPGSGVAQVARDGERVRLRFAPAYLIQSMTGSQERTRWRQEGELVFENASVEGELPACPGVLSGGDIRDNVYTYRDMVPIPLESRGDVGCALTFEDGGRIVIRGDSMRLQLEGDPKYIEHIRPG